MPRPPLNELNLFFFDAETGGLNPIQSDMIEVACLVTDPTGTDVIEEFSAKVFPTKPVDPGAAAVNGYTQEKWAAEATNLDEVMPKMVAMARNTLFAAHNAPFDWGFFEHALMKRAMRWPSDYHRIDTVALALPLLRAGKVHNLKLATLATYFGLAQEAAHTAWSDVRDCRSIYVKLMEIYAPLFGAK